MTNKHESREFQASEDSQEHHGAANSKLNSKRALPPTLVAAVATLEYPIS